MALTKARLLKHDFPVHGTTKYSAKRRAYFCKSIVIEMGGVSRFFSKVSGSGVDLTLLIDLLPPAPLPCMQNGTRNYEAVGRRKGCWNENSAQSFSDRGFWKPLRVVDVRAFGSWMSALKCLVFPGF